MRMDFKFILLVVMVVISCREDKEDQMPKPVTCGPYPDQSTSQYVLPYEVGKTYTIGQGNCSPRGRSHATGSLDQYSYDILMPIGSKIAAARAGEVVRVVEKYEENNGIPGQENVVEIKHSDNTFSSYFHITKDGALITKGARIGQGQIIALSGNTGNSTEPHLHFHVWRVSTTIPTVFKNTSSHPKGLVEGIRYTAMPY